MSLSRSRYNRTPLDLDCSVVLRYTAEGSGIVKLSVYGNLIETSPLYFCSTPQLKLLILNRGAQLIPTKIS